jgi:flagellar motor switch protein FliG
MTLSKLKTMPDVEIQNWLRKVGTRNAEALSIALLGAEGEVKRRVLRNMSPAARAALEKMIDHNAQQGLPAQTIAAQTGVVEKLM